MGPRGGARYSFAGFALALALGLALALSACAAREERVTLRVMSGQDPEAQAIDAVEFRSFEAAHPGVTIVDMPVPTGADYRETVFARIATSAPPDLFLLDGADVAAVAARGVVLDLQPFVAGAGVSLSRFFPQVIAPFRMRETLLAFPRGFSPTVYYYNRDLWDRAGLAAPRNGWTQSEFLTAVRALTRDTNGDGVVDQWGTTLDHRLGAWQAWMWSAGADVLTPDGLRATGAVDQPAAESTLTFLTQLSARGFVPPRAAGNAAGEAPDVAQRMFTAGRLGLLGGGHGLLPVLRRTTAPGGAGMRVGVVSVPRAPSHEVRTPLDATGWAVRGNTPHRPLAVALAAWMVRTSAQRRRAVAGLDVPALFSVAYEAAARDASGLEMEFLWQVPYGAMPWGARVARYREVETAMRTLMDRVVDERIPVKAAVRDAAKAADSVLAR